jgi:hypothetical protein
VAAVGGGELAQRRPVRPGAGEVVEKRRVDLVEDLVARPVKLDAEIGDEFAPVG